MSFKNLNFDCNLPASIFFNKNIEQTTVKLYACIRNLTHISGYCYATNKYLASLMDSSEASIKRWLKCLKREGYIDIETNKEGIHWERRLYLSDRFKKSLRRLTDELPPAHGRAGPSSRMSYRVEEELSKEELSKENPPTPKGEFFGRFVQLTKEEYSELSVKYSSDRLNEVIEEINDYIASSGRKPYKDYAATIRNWFRRRRTTQKSPTNSIPKEKSMGEIEADNRTWKTQMEKIMYQYIKEGKVYFGNNYIQSESRRVNVFDKDFIEQAKILFRAIGAMV